MLAAFRPCYGWLGYGLQLERSENLPERSEAGLHLHRESHPWAPALVFNKLLFHVQWPVLTGARSIRLYPGKGPRGLFRDTLACGARRLRRLRMCLAHKSTKPVTLAARTGTCLSGQLRVYPAKSKLLAGL